MNNKKKKLRFDPMTKKILSLIVLVFLTSSCSIYHVTSTNTTDDYYPSKNESDIIYLEQIDDTYEIIGIVTINGERKQLQFSDVIEKMKREAAILGGEAITDIKSDATGLWKRLPAQQRIGNAYVRANFTASVVISKE
jgi:hypothetical protein